MDRKTIVIKKYENRRLYDSTNSRYVNLEDVAQAIRDGADVRVVDAKTGEDITRVILTQIIVEDAKTPDSGFPLDFLRHMVVASGRAGQEGATKFMRSVLDAYRAISPLEFMSNLMNTPAKSGAVSPTESDQVSEVADTAPNVEQLRRRLEELENMVNSRLSPKKGTRKRAAKPRVSKSKPR